MEGPLFVVAVVAIGLGTVWLAFWMVGAAKGEAGKAKAESAQAGKAEEAQERRRDVAGRLASARRVLDRWMRKAGGADRP